MVARDNLRFHSVRDLTCVKRIVQIGADFIGQPVLASAMNAAKPYARLGQVELALTDHTIELQNPEQPVPPTNFIVLMSRGANSVRYHDQQLQKI